MDNDLFTSISNRWVVVLVCVFVGGGLLVGAFTISGDEDSLSVGEELLDGTDPFSGDTDDDGLLDDEERKLGTDPLDGDTDGDGFTDYDEATSLATSPTDADTDADGLDDYEEIISHGTAPTDADTDDDGLGDKEEVDEFGTDPTVVDTDADGLADGIEVSEYGTDPAIADTDGDGLQDSEEVDQYSSDPLTSDTDSDGLNDSKEIELGSDPTDADTDDDGLSDSEEVEYSTSLTTTDSDGDGLTDAEEVFAIESSEHEHWFSNASPAKMDVFIEIDYTLGNKPTESELEFLRDAFDEAPVTNPDGTRGINVNFVISDDPVWAPNEVGVAEYYAEYHTTEFDTAGYGFHHILIVDEVEDKHGYETTGGMYAGENGALVQAQSGNSTAQTIQHELGHTFGILPNDHYGVDSTTLSCFEYPSVMNYNCQRWDSSPSFSSGVNGASDFDDWSEFVDGMPNSSTEGLESEFDSRSSR